jgi:hypothetical protein
VETPQSGGDKEKKVLLVKDRLNRKFRKSNKIKYFVILWKIEL